METDGSAWRASSAAAIAQIGSDDGGTSLGATAIAGNQDHTAGRPLEADDEDLLFPGSQGGTFAGASVPSLGLRMLFRPMWGALRRLLRPLMWPLRILFRPL